MRTLKSSGKIARIDPATRPIGSTARSGPKNHITLAATPVLGSKAIKNRAEVDGSRNAHERDGAALIQFLSWLDRETERGAENVEITVVENNGTLSRRHWVFEGNFIRHHIGQWTQWGDCPLSRQSEIKPQTQARRIAAG